MEKLIQKIKEYKDVFYIPSIFNVKRYHYLAPIRIALNSFPLIIPNDLKYFYEEIGYAELFVDGVYGQSGIRLYDPYLALRNSHLIQKEEDIILNEHELLLGDFLGDSDRILLSNNRISIILPIYSRSEWLHTNLTFEEFLEKIIDNNGEKYWEME
jgi:hypothetical protein